MKVPLSAVLIAQDEQTRIADAVASAAFCDEVLVVDGGSRDRTGEVAAAAGARVLENRPFPGFVPQRRFAAAAARHDWLLVLDADERVTPALRQEIEALRALEPALAGYRIPRVTHYLGREIRGTDWYPDPQLRLLDRRRAHWPDALVHESARVDGPVGRLRGELEHRPYASVSDHLLRIDRYTTLWAEQAAAAGRRAGLVELAGAPAWAFVRNYLVRGGFLLGAAGFTVSRLNAFYVFLKLAKLRERSRA